MKASHFSLVPFDISLCLQMNRGHVSIFKGSAVNRVACCFYLFIYLFFYMHCQLPSGSSLADAAERCAGWLTG